MGGCIFYDFCFVDCYGCHIGILYLPHPVALDMIYEYAEIKGRKITIPNHNKVIGIASVLNGIPGNFLTMVWSLNGTEVLRIKNVPKAEAFRYSEVPK